MYMKLYSVDRP